MTVDRDLSGPWQATRAPAPMNIEAKLSMSGPLLRDLNVGYYDIYMYKYVYIHIYI